MIGIHVFKKTLARDLEFSKILELKACQLYTYGPRSLKQIDVDCKLINEYNLHVYVHLSHFTNIWALKPYTLKHLKEQIKAAKKLNAKGVIIHIPKIEPEEVALGVKNIWTKVGSLFSKQFKFILEMKSVREHETKSYETPKKINRLIDELKSQSISSNSVGICIDTAHIYASNAQITTYEQVNRYLSLLKYPQWITLIHLNGNEYESTRAGDKHAIPLHPKDKIWGHITYRDSGCRRFVEYCKSQNIDLIVEVRNTHSKKDIKKFIDLIMIN